MPLFALDTYRELSPHDQQEWLLTNGLGSFAGSSVVGMNMRRYHGIFCAATAPPLGRIMTVNRIGESLTLDGKADPLLEFSVNAFKGALHPRGDQYLLRFELEESAVWHYEIDGVKITKELQLIWMQNIAAVRYTIDAGKRAFALSLSPFVSLRDFHSLRRSDYASFQTDAAPSAVTVREGPHAVTITADTGRFVAQPSWWYGHLYPMETERGQDDTEDLFTPGAFTLAGEANQGQGGPATITLWITLGDNPQKPLPPLNFDAEIRRRVLAAAASDHPENPPAAGQVHPLKPVQSETVLKLFRAAGDFLVYRKSPSGEDGTTVIAGYPWFSDWGRDTMISLPGLLLCTRRFAKARQVLSLFARYVSQGMIPNRFDDYTNEPCYNTVDASLWFIHAAFEYRRLSHDVDTFEKILRPACRQILDGYRAGTRFFIKMDPDDGLISQGDPHTQLTWMDAKCNGIAFTPRQGKPVEINALWFHALVLMDELELAEKVSASFKKAFWISPFRGLADVVDGPRRDVAIRPNQIFAASLPNSPLSHDQQCAVVEVVQRELLTPMGLRTLNRGDPGYRGIYTGPQMQRDAAYHNGTVWAWLMGGFLDAYLKVNRNSAAARSQARDWLAPLLTHMADSGAIGQIAEIFDGDEPHRPVGCPAQAWSVAEVLRLASELEM
jgi:glycogen debranching enzyme